MEEERVMRAFLVVAVVAASAGPVLAQSANPAPPAARELVVKVRSWFGEGGELEVGSGVIVGADAERIYLATARHVVRKGEPATRVYVSLQGSPADSILATPSDSARSGIDVAVLTIPRAALPRGLPPLDRLGAVGKLKFGDPVSPMGCPQGVCWGVPVPADRIVGIDRQGIIFQSVFVKGGSSGGALFNQYWEVVGIVTEDEPPRANAVPIDEALALVRAWGYPVQLHRSKVPRAGYALHVGALLMTRVGGAVPALGGEGRFPSGRIVATRRGDTFGVVWHVSGLRLAPRNLAVTAAMGGLGVDFHYGRFTAQPFLELGIGRVEGRFDAGGYSVAGAGGTATYVPFWQQQKEDGLGVGGGLSVQAVVAPHITLELLAGHWSFNLPDSLPKLPNLFVGTGLRWGL
jgi:hypothetical protein